MARLLATIIKNNTAKLNQLLDSTYNKTEIHNSSEIQTFSNTVLTRLRQFTEQGGWTGNDYWQDPDIPISGGFARRGRSSIRYHQGTLSNYWTNSLTDGSVLSLKLTNNAVHAKYIFDEVRRHKIKAKLVMGPNGLYRYKPKLMWMRAAGVQWGDEVALVNVVTNPGHDKSLYSNYPNMPMTYYSKLVYDNIMSSRNKTSYNTLMTNLLVSKAFNILKPNSLS